METATARTVKLRFPAMRCAHSLKTSAALAQTLRVESQPVRPNTRVKLSAPSNSGGLTFVVMKASRRSLRASR
jgi:hypothetical protein